MSAHAYTEDQLVDQPAKRLPAEMGWSLAQPHPHLSPLPAGDQARVWVDETGLFGRETKREVVLVSRLRATLERLNASRIGHHALPPEAITAAVEELTRDRSGYVETPNPGPSPESRPAAASAVGEEEVGT